MPLDLSAEVNLHLRLLGDWVYGWDPMSEKIHTFSSFYPHDLTTRQFSGKASLIFTEDAQTWKLERMLQGSHSDIIRCILWDPEVIFNYISTFMESDVGRFQHSVIVTGGEDSRLSTWSISETSMDGKIDDEIMDVDQLVGKKRGRETSPSMEDELVEATRRRTS